MAKRRIAAGGDKEKVEGLLQERGTTHGRFEDNARISQHLKSVMYGNGYRVLHPVYAEALDMIALKIGRVLSGNPDEPDHWDDIAGYATLAANLARNGKCKNTD